MNTLEYCLIKLMKVNIAVLLNIRIVGSVLQIRR